MSRPRVFMIGWEFPPFNSGGLGIACQGLTQALCQYHIPQIFVLPKKLPLSAEHLEIQDPQNPYFRELYINLQLNPYGTASFDPGLSSLVIANVAPGNSMVEEALAYARIVSGLAPQFDFNVIHSHDWMTYPAALEAREKVRKPVVMHVHSTEFDRTLNGNVNPQIAEIEAQSLAKADRVIAVSHYTKEVIHEKYRIPMSAIEVIHNGIDLKQEFHHSISDGELKAFAHNRKVVIFMGRLTSQKGPDYFVRIAREITAQVPEALFVVAGSGDMYQQIVMQSGANRLTGKLLFTGFLREKQREFLYKRADLFIMPSVSEPFGLVALEAAAAHTPVIISKQSGVSEVMPKAMVHNYWDVHLIAQDAIRILKDDALRNHLAVANAAQVKEVTWGKAAQKCIRLYEHLIG